MAHARELLHTPARKKRKRIRRLRLAGIFVGGILVSAGLLSWVAHMHQIRIQTVAVNGNEVISGDDLRATVENVMSGSYAFLFPKDNAFFYPKDAILSALIKQFPRIKDVSARAEGFQTLSVSVTEREPSAWWCGDTEGESDCYLVDEGGLLYDHAPHISPPPYVVLYGALSTASTTKQTKEENAVRIGRNFLSASDFSNLITLRDTLARQGIHLTSFARGEHTDYTARLATGGYMLIDNSFPSTQIANAIIAAIETKKKSKADILTAIDYIDARFLDTGKVFIKEK
jgi:hypothetical protein